MGFVDLGKGITCPAQVGHDVKRLRCFSVSQDDLDLPVKIKAGHIGKSASGTYVRRQLRSCCE